MTLCDTVPWTSVRKTRCSTVYIVYRIHFSSNTLTANTCIVYGVLIISVVERAAFVYSYRNGIYANAIGNENWSSSTTFLVCVYYYCVVCSLHDTVTREAVVHVQFLAHSIPYYTSSRNSLRLICKLSLACAKLSLGGSLALVVTSSSAWRYCCTSSRGLLLRWVTVHGCTISPYCYLTLSHLGQLSLAVPSWVLTGDG